MRRIIALCDEDRDYVERLAEYFNRKGDGLKAVAFSEGDTEAFDAEMIVSFSEEKLASPDAKNILIYKYQEADQIYREVMKTYSDLNVHRLTPIKSQRTKVTTIYSPVNRSGKSIFAVTLGLAMAREYRTLLLTLDEYSGMFRYIAAEANTDLTDMIYSFKQGNFSWSTLAGSVYEFGQLKYIPPVRYAEDLLAISTDELAQMIGEVAAQGGYEKLIIDAGAYGKKAMELMELSDRVLMPVRSSAISGAKVDEFKELMDASGRGDLREKITEVRLPYDKKYLEVLTRPSDYMKGEMWEYVGEFVH